MVQRSQMLVWLTECDGDEIWSIEFCQQKKIPQKWIDELRDVYESGFRSDRESIYYRGQWTNQFEGLRAVDIACRIAAELKLPIQKIVASAYDRATLVDEIKSFLEEN